MIWRTCSRSRIERHREFLPLGLVETLDEVVLDRLHRLDELQLVFSRSNVSDRSSAFLFRLKAVVEVPAFPERRASDVETRRSGTQGGGVAGASAGMEMKAPRQAHNGNADSGSVCLGM